MLESIKKEEYGDGYNAAVMEHWKTCVEQANSNTEKRNNSNGLFITLNTGLFAVITFTGDNKSILLSVVGIVVCILWLNMIRSYQQLSRVKYDIVNEIEAKLPLAPFTHEWEKLKLEHDYVGLTKIEKAIPRIFLFLYVVAIIWPLLKLIIPLICPCCGGAT
jgi:hypothetical protein